jgi:membrane-bound serine protease (ClpP class)
MFAIGKGITAQRRKPVTGSQGMIGEIGTALSNLSPGSPSQVLVNGEIWNAESAEDNILEGMNVMVTGIKELKLFVRKV